MFGGKQFLYKALPVTGLDASFQTMQTIETIKNCGGSVVAIICDNNKVNIKFFGMFNLHIGSQKNAKNSILLMNVFQELQNGQILKSFFNLKKILL